MKTLSIYFYRPDFIIQNKIEINQYHCRTTIMTAYSQVVQLKQIINVLEDNLHNVTNKNYAQRQLFNQYISLFQKFSKNVNILNTKINEHIVRNEKKNLQSSTCIFKYLSNILSKIGNSAKNVATKGKNQIIDPLKLFHDNYTNLSKSFLTGLKQKQQQLSQKYSDLFKNKQNYISASERQQKTRKTQGKLMHKIQNGDLNQLQKFNSNIRKITQNIKITEQQYGYSVKVVNKCMMDLRKDLRQITASLANNQQSRINFTKKTLLNSVKNLKDLVPDYTTDIDAKLQSEILQIQKRNDQNFVNCSLNEKIMVLTSSQEKQQFVSYEEMLKQKRRKILQQQNAHLAEIFNKVKQEDKTIIRAFAKSLFQEDQAKTLVSPPNLNSEQWQSFRKKIISSLSYSYFFIETIYEEVVEMSSIYCKLTQDFFMLLLELFILIISNMKLNETGSASGIAIQFAYRIIHISMRVMWKKNTLSSRNQSIELLCQHLGKKCMHLQNEAVFIKIYSYIEKKKTGKKAPTSGMQSPRGMMSSFVKGMQQAMNMKKQAKLTEEQVFGCLIQLTYMMGNLLIPNQIAIPVIKKLLGKGENTKSFEFLKQILLQKKDQEERRKIFFRKQVKEKMQDKLNNIIKNNKIAEYCLKITAGRGYFGRSQIKLRLVCRQLKDIHQDILYQMKMATSQKWVHLIPYNNKINYQEVKKYVEEKVLPPAVEQIIVLDVNRSLHNHTDLLSQDLLKHLLRSYATFHPDIGYCQGMNYIAGYLYLKSKDEETAYRMFEYLMQHKFKQLFANQFQVLKVKLYQFERLLGIFHSQISYHFKKQGITPQCYIVSWIITIFASSYQYTQESYFIDLLWERFIIWGWRQFYRFVLAMFTVFKDQIIELDYDKAMHFLGAIAKCDLIRADREQYIQKYGKNHLQQLVEQYQISDELLESLEKQYELK